MRQYLFQIPFSDQLWQPDGWWLPGYGAMLLVAFLVVVWWGGKRSAKIGLPGPKLQDMAMVLFVTGIIGARILYMYQYSDQFKDRSLPGLLLGFISIWEGGLVVYGSVFGGFLGYLFYRHFVLKKLGINGWQLADVVAPLLALGMAVGRIGCYLNGCCWGQVAIVECQPVPLGADFGQFPLLPAHARSQVCTPANADSRLPQVCGLQTSTGFSLYPSDPTGLTDPRTVERVEPGSDAAAAKLMPADTIVSVNGRANPIVLTVVANPETLKEAAALLGPAVMTTSDTSVVAHFDDYPSYRLARAKMVPLAASCSAHDRLWELAQKWPKGGSELKLVVLRDGKEVPIAFTPRTVVFYPTQIYETISMLLLTLLLVCFQPFRRNDGQVMVMLMLGYAAHRFLNEAIRIEPTYALGLTLSQWISVLMFLAGVSLEVYLRRTQPKLPPGPLPLGYTPAPQS